MLSDYHIHTSFSADSETDPEKIIQRAVSLGMNEICFTDHMDYDFPIIIDERPFTFDPDEYFKQFYKLQHKYSQDLSVKIGIELGLQPSVAKRCKQLVSSYPFDFVIGSSHLLDGKDLYFKESWEGKNIEDVIVEYFKGIVTNIESFNDFNVYGHIDYFKRYIPDPTFIYDENKYQELIDMVLSKIIETGHGIELNSSKYENDPEDLNPSIRVLKRYKELGGDIITVGADSHTINRLGNGFDRLAAILKDAGFKYYCHFSKKEPEFIKLD